MPATTGMNGSIGRRELVLMTPHVSGWTDLMPEARAKAIAVNISRVASGEPPIELVA